MSRENTLQYDGHSDNTMEYLTMNKAKCLLQLNLQR